MYLNIFLFLLLTEEETGRVKGHILYKQTQNSYGKDRRM